MASSCCICHRKHPHLMQWVSEKDPRWEDIKDWHCCAHCGVIARQLMQTMDPTTVICGDSCLSSCYSYQSWILKQTPKLSEEERTRYVKKSLPVPVRVPYYGYAHGTTFQRLGHYNCKVSFQDNEAKWPKRRDILLKVTVDKVFFDGSFQVFKWEEVQLSGEKKDDSGESEGKQMWKGTLERYGVAGRKVVLMNDGVARQYWKNLGTTQCLLGKECGSDEFWCSSMKSE